MNRRTLVRALSGAVLLAAASACSSVFGSDATLIRLENASAVELTDVTFSAGHDPIHFDRIAPGGKTEYVEVDEAYSYGYVKVHANGQEYVLQPIDYVGEETIGDGRFTFRVALGGPWGLDVTLHEDR